MPTHVCGCDPEATYHCEHYPNCTYGRLNQHSHPGYRGLGAISRDSREALLGEIRESAYTTREERTEAKYAETSGYIVPAKGQKPTNPKQPIGSNKIPYHLWPFIASAYGSLGMLDGTLKYGRSNFRASGVKASIYIDACLRHLVAWFEGEENASDSGVSHLGHALACIAIILDARATGNFTDDRMYPGGYLSAIEELERVVATLRQRHADKTPHHFTIQDIGQTLASDPKEQV